MIALHTVRTGMARPAPRILLFLGLLAAGAVAAGCQLTALEAQYGVQFVVQGQTWDDLSVSAVGDALGHLPPDVRARTGNPALGPLRFLDNPDGRTSTGWSPYGRASNFYSNYEGMNEIVLAPDQGAFTVLHELGHAYQLRNTEPGKNARVVLQPEMQDFLAATGWHLLSSEADVLAASEPYQLAFSYDGAHVWDTISRQDPLEDYANSFAMYFLDPVQLQQLSLVRYDWAQRNIAGQP